MSENAKASSVNRAKLYQLVLFPLNNGATNVYYVLVLSYIATFGSNVLALGTLFASVMVTAMRLCDAITDPIIGALMDRTNGKFGKFRPFMAIGNLIMAASILVLYGITPMIPDTMMWARYAAFVGLYFVWVIGYTFQTSCTRSGQTVLTNDPKQRPLFTIFNTVGSLLGMGVMQFLAPILAKNYEGGYSSAGFFRTLAPVGIVMSIALTILAIIGIWEKDQPKYFGIGGEKAEKVKVSEYLQIIRENKPMQRLMIAGAGTKLALSIANNTTVLCMLYGCMMGAYDGLYLPMMVLGYACSVPFFILSVRTSQKKGQKASLTKYVSVALACYVGVLVLLLLWGHGDAFHLSLLGENGLSINLYTILFILFFGIGYGAYYATADMPIPMVADCSDYETYRSGKYIPGIMGTLFSLVDKLVSSLSATVVGILTVWAGAKRFLKDKTLVGEFVQAGYRSSAAVLGVAFIQNIYGSAGMAPLMILGSVPLFNIFAVLILMLESPEQRGVPDPKQLLRGVATNPILLGIVFGTVYALLPFTLPQIATKTISSIASLTTPLSLLSIGASFEGTKAIKKLGPTLAAAFIKTVGLAAVFLPCAVALGFRNEELVALLIMLGSPTTPSAYVMSRNMGHEGVLTSSCIALTTLLSALTLTGWIFVLRSGGYL